MLGCVAKISPLDILSGGRVDVRVSAQNDRRVTGMGGVVWEPAMVTPPALGLTLWNGDFTDSIAVAGATVPINMTTLKETYSFADFCMWIGAPVEIYADAIGTSWPWRQRFKGKVTGFSRKANVLSLVAEVDSEPFKANVLTKAYAGTGGAEGPAGIKDKVKPLVIGWAKNVEPMLIDADNSIYQFSAYGPIEAVANLFERGSDFGAPVADYATYAALVSATVPRGRWATCLSAGMIKLGAPAYGVITGDIRGHCIGTMTPRLTGKVISALAGIAGISSDNLEQSTLDALDLAVPYPINIVLTDQTKFVDIAQALALCCNAQAGVSLTGSFFAVRVGLEGQAALEIDAQGHASPQVTSAEEALVSIPYWKTTIGANRAWRVHNADEIAFEAPIVPRGLYSHTETYREGNWISLADGSEWLYISTTAGSGNDPPAWPATSNTWWQNKRPPTIASDLTYSDGTAIEALKPAQAGATVGAPAGTNVAGIPASSVASTISAGGGVASNQVATASVQSDAITSAQQASNASLVTGSNITTWQVLASFNMVLTAPGDIIAMSTHRQSFSSGAKQWAARLKINGAVVFDNGGTALADSVAMSGMASLTTAGTYAVVLEWAAQDSTVSVPSNRASLIALRRYK